MQEILLIADRPDIEKNFLEVLGSAYQVLCVHTEAEGLAALEDTDRAIVAVLIELSLARKNSFAFADTVKVHSGFNQIPMIAITDALPSAGDVDCLEHGFFDVLAADSPPALVYRRIGNAIQAGDSLSLTQLEKMLKQLPSCIFLKDTEGKYVFSTQYWHHLKTDGDPNWTIRGKTDLEIRKDQENARKAMEADRRILETGTGTDYIIEENEDGIQDFLQLIKRPVYDEDGRIRGIIALINNVTDYQLLKLELEKRANTDALTGLLNKTAAQDLVRMLLSGARRENDHSALLMIDADHFKRVNDTFGHAEGDRVLSELGRVIKDNCRAEDVAGRIGGDEFMVFMRSAASAENACRMARRLQEQAARGFAGTSLAGHVTLSIGIAICPDHGTRFEDLYRAADSALYEVKKNGRNAYRVH